MTTPTFLHNRSEYIVIDDGILSVTMKLSDFNYFEPSYSLESPYTWQYYIQGIRRTKNTDHSEISLPIPWTEGDAYISNVSFYLANLPIPPQTLEEAKSRRTSELYSFFQQINSGNINYTAMTTIFSPYLYNSNALITYKDRGFVPIGFNIADADGDFVVMTLAQLLELDSGIVDFHYLNSQNFSSHAAVIDTLTTIEDVMAYDITTGWPVIPYVI